MTEAEMIREMMNLQENSSLKNMLTLVDMIEGAIFFLEDNQRLAEKLTDHETVTKYKKTRLHMQNSLSAVKNAISVLHPNE